MALTRRFSDVVRARADLDREFRDGLFNQAIEAIREDDLETGKVLLRDFVDATLGLDTLAIELDQSPQSLIRVFSERGNARSSTLLAIIDHLKRRKSGAMPVSRAPSGLVAD